MTTAVVDAGTYISARNNFTLWCQKHQLLKTALPSSEHSQPLEQFSSTHNRVVNSPASSEEITVSHHTENAESEPKNTEEILQQISEIYDEDYGYEECETYLKSNNFVLKKWFDGFQHSQENRDNHLYIKRVAGSDKRVNNCIQYWVKVKNKWVTGIIKSKYELVYGTNQSELEFDKIYVEKLKDDHGGSLVHYQLKVKVNPNKTQTSTADDITYESENVEGYFDMEAVKNSDFHSTCVDFVADKTKEERFINRLSLSEILKITDSKKQSDGFRRISCDIGRIKDEKLIEVLNCYLPEISRIIMRKYFSLNSRRKTMIPQYNYYTICSDGNAVHITNKENKTLTSYLSHVYAGHFDQNYQPSEKRQLSYFEIRNIQRNIGLDIIQFWNKRERIFPHVDSDKLLNPVKYNKFIVKLKKFLTVADQFAFNKALCDFQSIIQKYNPSNITDDNKSLITNNKWMTAYEKAEYLYVLKKYLEINHLELISPVSNHSPPPSPMPSSPHRDESLGRARLNVALYQRHQKLRQKLTIRRDVLKDGAELARKFAKAYGATTIIFASLAICNLLLLTLLPPYALVILVILSALAATFFSATMGFCTLGLFSNSEVAELGTLKKMLKRNMPNEVKLSESTLATLTDKNEIHSIKPTDLANINTPLYP